jgi:hypothetical protein
VEVSVSLVVSATGAGVSDAIAELSRDFITRKPPAAPIAKTAARANQSQGLFSHLLKPRRFPERLEEFLPDLFLSTRLTLPVAISFSANLPPDHLIILRIRSCPPRPHLCLASMPGVFEAPMISLILTRCRARVKKEGKKIPEASRKRLPG